MLCNIYSTFRAMQDRDLCSAVVLTAVHANNVWSMDNAAVNVHIKSFQGWRRRNNVSSVLSQMLLSAAALDLLTDDGLSVWPSSTTVVFAESFLYCAVLVWRNRWCLTDCAAVAKTWTMSHCRLVSFDEAGWRFVQTSVCRWWCGPVAGKRRKVNPYTKEEDWTD